MPGNPSHRTHTRPALWGLKKQQFECMCVCACVCVHVLSWVYGEPRESERARVCLLSFSACCVLRVLFCVCRCVRRQISKNARWEASPYFQAVDGKQALGSSGLEQLEKFVEGAQ